MPKTLLTIYTHPDWVESTIHHIGESLTEGNVGYTVSVSEKKHLTWNMAAPFSVPYEEKAVLFTLSKPITDHQIETIMTQVRIGCVYGFTIKGEMNLGNEVTINNIDGAGKADVSPNTRTIRE